jgi:hypothetical protein
VKERESERDREREGHERVGVFGESQERDRESWGWESVGGITEGEREGIEGERVAVWDRMWNE